MTAIHFALWTDGSVSVCSTLDLGVCIVEAEHSLRKPFIRKSRVDLTVADRRLWQSSKMQVNYRAGGMLVTGRVKN